MILADHTNNRNEKKLGEYLLVSDGTVRNFIQKHQDSSSNGNPKKRIGEILVEEGRLTQEELENSLKKQRTDRLSRCSIFAGLSTMELITLSRFFTEVSYPVGKTFIMQGEEDPSLFIIASGTVKVFRINNAGEEISIAKVGVGEPIGEMGYFSGGRRTACVRTLEPTQLLQAQYTDLTNYFENVPHVALAFTAMIKKRKEELEQLES